MGSSRYITNLDGEIVQHVEYVPFGEVFIEERNNSWKTPYLFNGKELDEETGLYYYGARYYNPRESFWLSVDTIHFEDDFYDDDESYNEGVYNSFNLNPYTYSYQNPVKYVDPDGNNPIPAIARLLYRAYRAYRAAEKIAPKQKPTSAPKPVEKPKPADKPSNKGETKQDVKSSRNKPKEEGVPNSSEIQQIDPKTGKVTKYTTYDKDGKIVKEYRGEGKDHGNIPRPNVKEPKYIINPKTGKKFKNGYEVRRARQDEIPK
ncbi:RHS repeat-associated core domain-containing protein [Apibacter mensalis]|uniref:RHS repeat-associated core domain-containing protein n=1 Tax=Apibacter mensalis TaxID=1586267 RepID=UPI0026F05CBF|nr:RHS repeat-associated core domain-containing protein [Apibacter mensalis]